MPVARRKFRPKASTDAPVTPPPSGGGYPAWRVGVKDTWYSIANTAGMPGATNVVAATLDVWNGLAPTTNGFISFLASGHGEWRNGVHKLDLTLQTPTWTTLHEGSVPGPPQNPWSSLSDPIPYNGSPVTYGPMAYYRDGLPMGRHNYDSTWWFPATHDKDGLERVMAFGCYNSSGLNQSPDGKTGEFMHGPQTDGFKIASRAYDPAGYWGDSGGWKWPSAYVTHAQDPRDYKMYTVNDNQDLSQYVYIFLPTTGTWDAWLADPQYPAAGRLESWHGTGQACGTSIDTKDDQLCCLLGGADTQPGVATLVKVDLHTHKVSRVTVSGIPLDAVSYGGGSLIFDPDNDRFVYVAYSDDNTNSVRVYTLNKSTGASTQMTSLPPTTRAGSFNRAWYFAAFKAIVYVPGFDSDIYYMPTA